MEYRIGYAIKALEARRKAGTKAHRRTESTAVREIFWSDRRETLLKGLKVSAGAGKLGKVRVQSACIILTLGQPAGFEFQELWNNIYRTCTLGEVTMGDSMGRCMKFCTLGQILVSCDQKTKKRSSTSA